MKMIVAEAAVVAELQPVVAEVAQEEAVLQTAALPLWAVEAAVQAAAVPAEEVLEACPAKK
jgi:hypothetical protein